MHARLRCGMNRAGHRHQLWRARTEQQQQVVVGAPGDLRDGASSTSEGRAAEPLLGSASITASMMDGWESSLTSWSFSFLGFGMPTPLGRGIFTCRTPRAQGAHGRRQQDRPSCGGGHPPQDGAGGGPHTYAGFREQGSGRSAPALPGGRSAARNADKKKSFPGGTTSSTSSDESVMRAAHSRYSGSPHPFRFLSRTSPIHAPPPRQDS